jgi:hypothetical protein
MLKIFYFISISVKCIFCRVTCKQLSKQVWKKWIIEDLPLLKVTYLETYLQSYLLTYGQSDS